jgi:para-aminobenzoate synthetase component 1
MQQTLIVTSLPFQESDKANISQYWFERIRSLPYPVLLSSGQSGHRAANFDILTADPEILLSTHEGNTLIKLLRENKEEIFDGSPFEALEKYSPIDCAQEAIDDLPFTGGAIGWFSYELLHKKYGLTNNKKKIISLPEMQVGVYTWAILINHRKQECLLISRGLSLDAHEKIIVQLEKPASISPPIEFSLNSPFTSNFTKEQYLERFQRINDYIHAGDCYQVNLAQCFTAECSGDPFSAFLRLQALANAPFAAYLQNGHDAVMSFSPERFLKVQQMEVMTQPIKGTRPRDQNPAQDSANRIDLETSTKDRAENLMIVDLLRNDLGKVCSVGSVSVSDLFETQSFTNVHHLVSTIKGKLESACDVYKLIEAGFPGGSITGTPKKRAMEIIDDLETMPRSVYCGCIAWIDRRGNMDSNICIRTLIKHGNRIHCWGGGGLVADSKGPDEFQETLDKISLFMNNL